MERALDSYLLSAPAKNITGFFLTALLLACFASPQCLFAQDEFLRGESSGDGQADILDTLITFNFGFLGGPPPPCLDAADFDDDGFLVPILDGIGHLTYLFLLGPPSPPPGFVCGLDPTLDALDCIAGSITCP